jgi:hypothetical protein
MFGQTHSTIQDTTIRTTPADAIALLADQAWLDRMTPDDWRALTPLIYAHINPYGTFELDRQKRLYLEAA